MSYADGAPVSVATHSRCPAGVELGPGGKLDAAMIEDGIDALVVTSPENVHYVSGAPFSQLRITPEEVVVAIRASSGQTRLVVPDWLVPYATQHVEAGALVAWRLPDSPIEATAAALSEMGIASGRLGVETQHLVAALWEDLKDRLPTTALVSADALLMRVRSTKSESEVALIHRSGTIADAALDYAFAHAEPGMTEKELAAAIRGSALARGADEVRWLFLTPSGESNYGGGAPQDRVLRGGDLVRCDLGCVVGEYHSDIARTAVVPPSSAKQRETYAALWEVHERAIELLEVGRSLGEVYERVATDMARSGLECIDSYIGHGVGLGVHELPLIAMGEVTVINAGMVLCIEPAHYEGQDVFHVEDVVLTTNQGPRILSRSPASGWERLPELGSKSAE